MDSSTTTQRLVSLAAILSLILIYSTPSSSSVGMTSAYEILQDYNFPVGLLPEGVVTGYDLNFTSGKFSVYLNESCSFTGSSYQLNFKPTIKGFISNSKVSSLEGVSVKLMFVWMNIVEIFRTKDDINLSIGYASAWFPVEYFEESPQCGCGLNCGALSLVRKLKAKLINR